MYYWEYIYTKTNNKDNFSLLILNSNLTRHPVFYLAALQTPPHARIEPRALCLLSAYSTTPPPAQKGKLLEIQ